MTEKSKKETLSGKQGSAKRKHNYTDPITDQKTKTNKPHTEAQTEEQ